jgi:hypothetical protein
MLTNYQNLVGTHINGCKKLDGRTFIDPKTGEKWWIK